MNKELHLAGIAAQLERLAAILKLPKQQRDTVVPETEVEDMIKHCKELLGSIDFPKIKI